MTLSESGLNFIKQYEGFVDHLYKDEGGILHIGYGHRVQPGESYPDRITPDEGLALLGIDTGLAQNTINSTVRVPLSQQQFDALVSLVFNWGPGNWRKSSHLRYLNSGDYAATARRISEFPVTANGIYSAGLANRRRAESMIFLSGTSDAGTPAPAGSIDETGDEDVSESGSYLTYFLGAGVLFLLALFVVRR